jgi:competence protein ComEC
MKKQKPIKKKRHAGAIFAIIAVIVILAFSFVAYNYKTIAPFVEEYVGNIDIINDAVNNDTGSTPVTEVVIEKETPEKPSLSNITNSTKLIPNYGSSSTSSPSGWQIDDPFVPDPYTSLLTNPPTHPLNDLTIYIFNIGSDSYFIDTAADDVMNDAGSLQDGNALLDLLERINKTKIDVMITSHHSSNHADGLVPILDSLPVTWVLDSGSAASQDYLSRATTKNFTVVRTGDVYQLSPNITLEILNPSVLRSDERENSIVYRMTFKDFRMLFTGDCASQCQADVLSTGYDISADVLKVPYHGALLSQEFLDAVNPTTAVISSGIEEGVPVSQTVLDMLSARNAYIYTTSGNGNIVVTTNGISYQVLTER